MHSHFNVILNVILNVFLNVSVISILIVIIIISSFLQIIYEYQFKNEEGFFADAMRNRVMGTILQVTAVFTQLMIIVGLSLDGGESYTAKFLNTSVMQFLGRISMALYLVHVPVMHWICVYLYGPSFQPKTENKRWPPLWTTPIQLIISLILATALTIYLEEKVKKKLKTPKNSRKFRVGGAVFVAFGVFFLFTGTFIFRSEIIL